jgi:hypothetical protein
MATAITRRGTGRNARPTVSAPARRRIVVAVIAGLMASSCTAHPSTTPPATPPGPASTSVAADHDTDGVAVAPSVPAGPAAVDAAVTFVRAWAHPERDATSWFAGVRDLVTGGYAGLLADTDPTGVPARTVTGSARVLSATAVVVVVEVPTDAGPVQVTVVAVDGGWLVAGNRPSVALPGTAS